MVKKQIHQWVVGAQQGGAELAPAWGTTDSFLKE